MRFSQHCQQVTEIRFQTADQRHTSKDPRHQPGKRQQRRLIKHTNDNGRRSEQRHYFLKHHIGRYQSASYCTKHVISLYVWLATHSLSADFLVLVTTSNEIITEPSRPEEWKIANLQNILCHAVGDPHYNPGQNQYYIPTQQQLLGSRESFLLPILKSPGIADDQRQSVEGKPAHDRA